MDTALTDNEEVALQLLADCSNPDANALAHYFADDAVWLDQGLPPRVGRRAIVEHLEAFFHAFSLRIETLYIASRGNVVFTERIDYLQLRQNGREIQLPVVGVMEMRDGLIAAWRDYSDLRTSEEGLGIPDARGGLA